MSPDEQVPQTSDEGAAEPDDEGVGASDAEGDLEAGAEPQTTTQDDKLFSWVLPTVVVVILMCCCFGLSSCGEDSATTEEGEVDCQALRSEVNQMIRVEDPAAGDGMVVLMTLCD